jgi:glutamate/tyrosine decarboxylase-like PLP-dependent enzyme
MPPFEARLKLNGRDPVVSVAPATDSGYSAVAGGCGRAAWRRSIVAFVRLPHVRSASLSQHTFAVARMGSGWVLWAVVH